MSENTIQISWPDCIVIFNSLMKNIENLRVRIESDELDDDELYDAEEELNDYIMALSRLREKYSECSDKGELPAQLLKKLNSIA